MIPQSTFLPYRIHHKRFPSFPALTYLKNRNKDPAMEIANGEMLVHSWDMQSIHPATKIFCFNQQKSKLFQEISQVKYALTSSQ